MQYASVAMGENAPVSCCLCSNRNLLISRAPTKAKSQEAAYSQALNQNKIERQRSRSRESGRQTCSLGCIECPWEKFFSSQSTNKGNRKLPFYMGFKNIEKFFRNFNVSCSHQRVEVTENRDFP